MYRVSAHSPGMFLFVCQGPLWRLGSCGIWRKVSTFRNREMPWICSKNVTFSVSHSASQSAVQPASQSANQPVSQSTSRSISQPANQSTSQPASQATSQSVSQSASRSISQPISQPPSQSTRLAVETPDRHMTRCQCIQFYVLSGLRRPLWSDCRSLCVITHRLYALYVFTYCKLILTWPMGIREFMMNVVLLADG